MSAAAPASHHELDDRLADANMFAWYGPSFRLAFKHWPVSLAACLVSIALNQAFFFVLTFTPWLHYGLPGLVTGAGGLFHAIVFVVLGAVAYRFVAQRENVGEVNAWGFLIVRALQIAAVWLVAAALVTGAIVLGAVGFGMALNDFADLGTLIVLGVILLVVLFLLMPIWFSLAVAGALSTVYAVRSAEGPFGAVAASLRLAFEQKWRVFWPSYLLAILAAVLYWVVNILQSAFFGFGLVLALLTTFVTTAVGIMMTFVIERAYAPHLTLPEGGEAGAELPSRPKPGLVPPPPRARPAAASAAPLPTAPSEIAALLASDMSAHRVQRVVETVEAGLAADTRFFVAQPDHTLTVAKRLAAVQRSDLALRLMQPYLKEHREHRQHLTVALYVANLLRDMKRAPDAVRFLAQVKTLYPNEPMVDQLIKITNKALAAEGAPQTT